VKKLLFVMIEYDIDRISPVDIIRRIKKFRSVTRVETPQ
jgi:hypothetical protein